MAGWQTQSTVRVLTRTISITHCSAFEKCRKWIRTPTVLQENCCMPQDSPQVCQHRTCLNDWEHLIRSSSSMVSVHWMVLGGHVHSNLCYHRSGELSVN